MGESGIPVTSVHWPREQASPNALDLIRDGEVDLVVNIPKDASEEELDNDYLVRRKAVDFDIPLITNVQIAKRFADALAAGTGRLLASRDTPHDVGTAISTAQEADRRGPADVAAAALKRLEEALRVIEEHAKPAHPQVAERAESLRYRAYTLFDWTGLIYLLLGFLALQIVWALGSGEADWNRVMESFQNPIYIGFHVLSFVVLVWYGARTYFKLFTKTQPPMIGPMPRPPLGVFPPALAGVWIVVSVALVVVLGGIWP